jgi:MFS family permease
MKLNLNRVIKYLIYSDLVFYTGWGLISPLFAVFILESIDGGNALIVGMASAVHLIIRSLLRVPFGMYADKKGQKISYSFMFYGLLIAAFVPIGYIYSHSAWQIFVLQAILGISLAMSTAGWTCIFARHMDKGKESTEWGVDAVAVGIGPGIAGALGGLAVTYFSFNLVFVAVTLVGLIGTFLLVAIKKNILKDGKKEGKIFLHREIARLKKRTLH